MVAAEPGSDWVRKGCKARMQAAAERTPSTAPSMAEGASKRGAVKPWTVTWGGRVGSRERRQASVMLGVALGLMRRMLMWRGWGAVEVMEGRSMVCCEGEDKCGVGVELVVDMKWLDLINREIPRRGREGREGAASGGVRCGAGGKVTRSRRAEPWMMDREVDEMEMRSREEMSSVSRSRNQSIRGIKMKMIPREIR